MELDNLKIEADISDFPFPVVFSLIKILKRVLTPSKMHIIRLTFLFLIMKLYMNRK